MTPSQPEVVAQVAPSTPSRTEPVADRAPPPTPPSPDPTGTEEPCSSPDGPSFDHGAPPVATEHPYTAWKSDPQPLRWDPSISEPLRLNKRSPRQQQFVRARAQTVPVRSTVDEAVFRAAAHAEAEAIRAAPKKLSPFGLVEDEEEDDEEKNTSSVSVTPRTPQSRVEGQVESHTDRSTASETASVSEKVPPAPAVTRRSEEQEQQEQYETPVLSARQGPSETSARSVPSTPFQTPPGSPRFLEAARRPGGLVSAFGLPAI